jgi:hypothetical protein
MRKLLEYDVEVQRLDGSVGSVKMVWPPALTKGQRVNVPVNDRDWTKAEVIEVRKKRFVVNRRAILTPDRRPILTPLKHDGR